MPQSLPEHMNLQAPLWSGEDFQHPDATHQILLGNGVRVAYLLERSSRRSIGFQVGPEGLRIRAPRWVGMAQIEAALLEKSRWIVQKLQEQSHRQDQSEVLRIEWRDQTRIPFLGGHLVLFCHPDAPKEGMLLSLSESEWTLHLPVQPTASAAQIRAVFAAWWLRYARGLFTARLHHFAPQLQVQWRSLRLTNAKTRWGSAKSDGSIMLNWRLLHCQRAVIDYVVVHELSHLRVMDHSPRFWAVVHEVLPDYAHLRKELRAHVSPVWV